jgi:hypothetical protein
MTNPTTSNRTQPTEVVQHIKILRAQIGNLLEWLETNAVSRELEERLRRYSTDCRRSVDGLIDLMSQPC